MASNFYKIYHLFAGILTAALFFLIPDVTLGSHDTLAPTEPRGVTGHGLSDSSIELTWWPSQDNVGIDHYNIYRCQGQFCSGILVSISPSSSFTDSGLVPNTIYSYSISAVDPEGNESPLSIQRDGYSRGIATNPTGGNISISIVNSPPTVAPGQSFSVSWQRITNPPAGYDHHDAHFQRSLDLYGCNESQGCWYVVNPTDLGNSTFSVSTTAPPTTQDIYWIPDPHASGTNYNSLSHQHYPLARIVVTNGNPLAITTTSLPNATPNTPYSQTILHNNSAEAVGPFSCGISQGRLPNNLRLDPSTCVISGTSNESGTFPFTVRVKATSENYAMRQLTLTVGNSQTPVSQLIDISTRALVQTGNNVTIGGFIIGGSVPKTVLIRARGPSMGGVPFNVQGTLADPFMQLYSFAAGGYIAQNDNWQTQDSLCSTSGYTCGTPAQIIATGLDPCQPNPGQGTAPPGCSQESAILITLPPGNYGANVSGVSGGMGVGLVEVFEVGTSGSTLINISTRARVETGENVEIGGFIIGGSSPKTVLIRARGPSMSGAPFFVPGTLSNPTMQLYSFGAGAYIATNDNWQDAPSCSAGYACGDSTQIVATALDPCQPNPGETTAPLGCAQESAILITLPPGNYGAIVIGVGGGTGVGLVEIFEVSQ